MFISVVQFEPKFGDIEANYSKVSHAINSDNSDIIVFPELCLTGYDFVSRDEAKKIALEVNDLVFKELKNIAIKEKKIIVIGFPEISGDNLYNSAAILLPNPQLNNVYRKTHLFFRERFIFDEGDKGFFVIESIEPEIKIGTMICYDWRFPEASRTLALNGADLIVCPSNLVTNVWHIATPARALENKVYLAVANRIGTENRNEQELLFNGSSQIYSYNGSVLAKAQSDSEEIISAEIEPIKTRNKSFNEFNDIFADRRSQYYL
jgi:predicted amidohydrolase